MHVVLLAADAQREFDELPLVIKARVIAVVERLARWPAVSGAKPLRGKLKGTFRIRTGDWRILFRVEADSQRLTIWRISNRKHAYED